MEKWHAFDKWQNWPICKGYSKANSSKLTYIVATFRGSKIIQNDPKHTVYFSGKRAPPKTLKFKRWHHFALVILCEKRLKNTLSIREIISFWMLAILQRLKQSKMVNNGLFWVGTLKSQKHTITTLQSHCSNSMQKSAKKHT